MTTTDTRQLLDNVRREVAKVVVGQEPTVYGLLAALLAGGHVLLEGVPGVAKTLMVKALGAALRLDVRRVQFTPDLMPSDVTGNLVYESGTGRFDFRPGPIFTNVLLADEINRTPPKTQAALLEAMEERQVSVEGEAHGLPVPFLVVATQNPVEFEGTYPLPEAQLDRFLMKLRVGYPSSDDEKTILRRHDEGLDPHDLEAAGVTAVAGADEIATARSEVREVTVSDDIVDYLTSLAGETRGSPSLALGVSPRGTAMLLHVAKAWAYLHARDYVVPDDVKALVAPAWRHRIQVRPEAELDGATPDGVLSGIVERTEVPR
ncbi:MAG: MoxR family ATPase [Nitriliruptorales bacterium]|nr:MoxR family ATPase [Nitriliruptorales bacterium]